MTSALEDKAVMVRLITAGMEASDHAELHRGHYVVLSCDPAGGFAMWCLGDDTSGEPCSWREEVRTAA